MAGWKIENIMDVLTCPLCHQIFKDPVLLQSCGHNFCCACLQGQCKSGDMEGQDKKCPTCQKICPADMYAPNIAVNNLVEKAKEAENKEVRQTMTSPQDMSDQLTCGLCHKTFRDPVVLQTCGHIFCHECLQKRSTSTDQGETVCPTCQKKCPKESYVHDMVLANLAKRINHPINQDEERTGQEEGQGQRQEERQGQEEGEARDLERECEEHMERISLFCLNDQSLCCLVCRDSMRHVHHEFLPLREASTMIKVNLIMNIPEQLMLLNKIMDMSKIQEEKITEHKADKLQMSDRITNEFEKLREFINEAEREQRRQLDTMYDPILRKMKDNSEDLIKKQTDLMKNMEECQKKRLESDIGILQDIKEFVQQHCKTEKIEENLTVIKEKPSVGLFKGPLQYYTWKSMLSVVQPAPSPLTLDPETANRGLLVSQDFTSVFYKPSFFRRVPDSPKRFSHFTVSLTREGFSDGRHYWEVDEDVNTNWTVGVAKETLNRKATNLISVRDDFWAIEYHNHSQCGLHALTQPIKRLGTHISPKRIGVYLDYQGGQISFYDAQKMTHLHSFTTTLTGKVYPYVATISTKEGLTNIVHLGL